MQTSAATGADADLERQQGKVRSASERFALQWISSDVVAHALVSSILTGFVYVGLHYDPAATDRGVSPINQQVHLVTGVVLGMLLVGRVVVGIGRASEAAAQVINFNKSCRTLAVLSTFVTETLTISAGAELEKRAASKFRYELVRLLNLAFYSHQLMLKGLKLKAPPAALQPQDGGTLESEVLCAVSNPTVQVCKNIAGLIQAQQAAGRIKAEQVGTFCDELRRLIETHHTTHGLLLSPSPVALNSFSYFFTMVWVYWAIPLVASSVYAEEWSMGTSGGFIMAAVYAFVLALFMFGLYEAGRVIEAPMQTVLQLVPLDDMSFTLSDDLTNLVDDPDHTVPVFLAKA
jgi:predicted membrane chloride channel (bestrophin family)